MRNTKPGAPWRKKVLSFYIEGLLHIVAKIEKKEVPGTVVIKGSSYFFSDRTVERLGFELGKTELFERFNLLLNVVDLTWQYSLAHGKFILPNVLKVQTAKITGERLVEQKMKLESLYQFLNREAKVQQ